MKSMMLALTLFFSFQALAQQGVEVEELQKDQEILNLPQAEIQEKRVEEKTVEQKMPQIPSVKKINLQVSPLRLLMGGVRGVFEYSAHPAFSVGLVGEYLSRRDVYKQDLFDGVLSLDKRGVYKVESPSRTGFKVLGKYYLNHSGMMESSPYLQALAGMVMKRYHEQVEIANRNNQAEHYYPESEITIGQHWYFGGGINFNVGVGLIAALKNQGQRWDIYPNGDLQIGFAF